MREQTAGRAREDTAVGLALLGLLTAGTTDAVVAVADAVTWAWWTAGGCLLVALLVGVTWSGPDGERPARRGRGRAQQVQLVFGEVEPAALVRRHP